MATYDSPRPSSQPVGSTDPAVVKDDLITLDRIVTSTSATETNRKGGVRKTLLGLEVAAQEAFRLGAGDQQGDYVGGVSVYEESNWTFTYNGQQWGLSGDFDLSTLPYLTTEADPNNDSNLAVRGNASQEYVQTEITRGQGENIGGKIFPTDDDVLADGMIVPAGTTHLRVLIGGEPAIVAMSPVASGVVSLLTEAGATIGVTDVSFSNALAMNFHTLADLKTSNLAKPGYRVSVRRYYAGGEELNILYDIVTLAEYAGTPDGYGDHLIANGNVAKLVVNSDRVDARWFGITPSNDARTANMYALNDWAAFRSIRKFSFAKCGPIKIDRSDVREAPFGHALIMTTPMDWVDGEFYRDPDDLIGEDARPLDQRPTLIYFKDDYTLNNCVFDGSADSGNCSGNLETNTVVSISTAVAKIINCEFNNSVSSGIVPAGTVKIINSKFNFFGDHAVYLRSPTYLSHAGTLLLGCEFIQGNNGDRIYQQLPRDIVKLADNSRHIRIIGNYFEGAQGVNLEALAQFITVEGNQFVTSYTGVQIADPDGSNGAQTRAITITNNTFADYQEVLGVPSYGGWRTAGLIFNAASNLVMRDLLVSDNQFRNANIQDGFNGCTIEKAKFKNNIMWGCQISLTTVGSKNNVIDGNEFYAFDAGLYIRGPNKVTNNTFDSCERGISVNNAVQTVNERLIVDSNTFIDCPSGVFFDQQCHNLSLRNNTASSTNPAHELVSVNGLTSAFWQNQRNLNNVVHNMLLTSDASYLPRLTWDFPPFVSSPPTKAEVDEILLYLQRTTDNGQ